MKRLMRIYMDVFVLTGLLTTKHRIESEVVLTILNRCLCDWVLVGSEVIDYGISKIPDDERKRRVEILISIAGEKVIVDEDIVRRASELENIGLRAVDALHVACAERSVDVMLTTDDELLKKVKINKNIITYIPHILI